MAFKVSVKGPKQVPPPKNAKLLHGTWPSEPRIKPLGKQTMYGKTPQQISPTMSGGGFGSLMEPQEP